MFKHLLVPVDGGELSERAMSSGIALAQQLGAAITAFIAEPLAPVPSPGLGPMQFREAVRQHDEEQARRSREVLADFERRAQAAGVRFAGMTVQTGEIDLAIADAAKDKGCDLIMMVTHGRGLFGELLFGSHTKGVMARSKLPLLVMH